MLLKGKWVEVTLLADRFLRLGDIPDDFKLTGNQHDIAVNKQNDSTFALTCDWWAGNVDKKVGQPGPRA